MNKKHKFKVQEVALLFTLLLALVLSASASLKDSGTFEAWVSADSLTNGTVWRNKTKKLMVM